MAENLTESVSEAIESSNTSLPLAEGDKVVSKKTGQIGLIVTLMEDRTLALVKSTDSDAVFYSYTKELQRVVEGENTISPAALARLRGSQLPVEQAIISSDQPRFNLNTVTPDQIMHVLKGITIESAKLIVSTRDSQTSGQFKDWDSVKLALGKDFDIDMIQGTNRFYIQPKNQ